MNSHRRHIAVLPRAAGQHSSLLLRSAIAAAVVCAFAACVHGTTPSKLRANLTGAGANVAVRLSGESWPHRGELFAVDSLGIHVRGTQLEYLRWSILISLDVLDYGSEFDLVMDEAISPEKLARLRLVSRFPQGLSGALLTRVLKELKQDSVSEVRSMGTPAAGRTPSRPEQHAALDALADEAARRTAPYMDRRVAIADGYRRIGADFPGMGEHWVHPGTLMSGRLDPARPTLLAYATIDGKPVLQGVGFVVTTNGDSPPPGVAGWPDAWHEHSGLLADESGVNPGRASPSSSGTRVWVLHAWTRLDNPNGRYAPDNWAMPFARLGIVSPRVVDADAGRALSLTTGGDAFLRGILGDAGLLRGANAAAVDSAITLARARAHQVAARARDTRVVQEPDLDELRLTWASLHARLRAELGPNVDPHFAPPHTGGASHQGHRPTSSSSPRP